jgi:hypothetical protein
MLSSQTPGFLFSRMPSVGQKHYSSVADDVVYGIKFRIDCSFVSRRALTNYPMASRAIQTPTCPYEVWQRVEGLAVCRAVAVESEG